MPADVGAAGDAGAAGDRGVRANAHVVAHLDLVVELDALFEHRIVDRAAIDRGVGADLDVVADAYGADLRNLDPAALFLGDAEAVGADHGTGMDDDARADRATGIHHHARIKRAVVTDAYALADDAARADRHALAELRAFRDHCSSMHAGLLHHQRIEKLREPREIGVRIVGDDARKARLRFRLRAEHHGARAGRREFRAVARAGEEADVARARTLERGDLVHARVRVAGYAAAEALHDLAERQRPRHRFTWRAACPRAP